MIVTVHRHPCSVLKLDVRSADIRLSRSESVPIGRISVPTHIESQYIARMPVNQCQLVKEAKANEGILQKRNRTPYILRF